MKLSFWNQHYEYSGEIASSQEEAYKKLFDFYQKSSKSFVLSNENHYSSFRFRRGNILMSMIGVGSELWFRHEIEVAFIQKEEKVTKIEWKINLKVFGAQVGSNAIIEECKRILGGCPTSQ